MSGQNLYPVDWSPGTGLPYPYRVAHKDSEAIYLAIQENTAEVIATHEELASIGYAIKDEIQESFSNNLIGLDRITAVGTEIRDAIFDMDQSVKMTGQRVIHTLERGFSMMLLEQKATNDRLDQLIEINKRQIYYWALELFQEAVRDVKNGWYPEALDRLNLVISGNSSNPGLPTEFRAHLLKGAIQLGDPIMPRSDQVDVGEALKSFLSAARYAEPISKDDAGQALIFAGRCEMILGKLEYAEQYTQKGLVLKPMDRTGQFQLARIMFLRSNYGAGIPLLVELFINDPELSIAAASLPEFMRPKAATDAFRNAIEKARDHHAAKANEKLKYLRQQISRLEHTIYTQYKAALLVGNQIELLHKNAHRIGATLAWATLLGAAKLRIDADKSIQLVDNAFKIFINIVDKDLRRQIGALNNLLPTLRQKKIALEQTAYNAREKARESKDDGFALGFIAIFAVMSASILILSLAFTAFLNVLWDAKIVISALISAFFITTLFSRNVATRQKELDKKCTLAHDAWISSLNLFQAEESKKLLLEKELEGLTKLTLNSAPRP